MQKERAEGERQERNGRKEVGEAEKTSGKQKGRRRSYQELGPSHGSEVA